jgi:hypothetical protein
MGLDIHLQTDHPVLQNTELDEEHFHSHSLSRTFCNLMCRRNNGGEEEPELDQIGRLTGVDITPLYEMDTYPEEEGLEFQLSMAADEAEEEQIRQEAEDAKAHLAGNVDRVQATVEALLTRLPEVDDLPHRLTSADHTEADYAPYFSDFLSNPGDGYIGNNFGQDLRNFRSYLHYVKEAGGTTVFFTYG